VPMQIRQGFVEAKVWLSLAFASLPTRSLIFACRLWLWIQILCLIT